MKEWNFMNRSALLAFAVLFVSTAALAAENEYQCPDQIEASSGSAKAPKGFEVWEDKQEKFFLDGVTMYSGHPKDMASLVPDISDKQSDGWTISPDDKYGYWIACSYKNTTQVLIKKIGAGIKSCSVRRAPEGDHSFKINCK